MANKGTSNGKTIMSEQSWNQFHANPDTLTQPRTDWETTFVDGGVAVIDGVAGFYGWEGFGGSIFQWNS